MITVHCKDKDTGDTSSCRFPTFDKVTEVIDVLENSSGGRYHCRVEFDPDLDERVGLRMPSLSRFHMLHMPPPMREAARFAQGAHREQKRADGKTSFFNHPMRVGSRLWATGFPETVVIAGILHDTVEDTDVTLENIRRTFGEAVHYYVDMMTRKMNGDTYREYIESMLGDPFLRAIKIADIEDNLSCDEGYVVPSLKRRWMQAIEALEKKRWTGRGKEVFTLGGRPVEI